MDRFHVYRRGRNGGRGCSYGWRRRLNRQRDSRRGRGLYRSRSRRYSRAYNRSALPAVSRKYKPGNGSRRQRCTRNQQRYFPDSGFSRRAASLLKKIAGNIDPSPRTGSLVFFMLYFFQGIKNITHTVMSPSGKKPTRNTGPEPFMLVNLLKLRDHLRCNRRRNRAGFTGPGHDQRPITGHIYQSGNAL